MSLNKYFKQFQGQTNEADLFQKLTTEYIQIGGVDSYYIKRDMEDFDNIFNEDRTVNFGEGICIEIFIENFEGFEGNDIISKFGLELLDELKFVVSAERFCEEVDMEEPREGALIYLPLADRLFEIKFVEDEELMYSLNDTRSYTVVAQIFDYSGETFETGIEELDSLDDLNDNVDHLNLDADTQNDIFDEEDDGIVDFSEDNIFGTFGN